MNTKEKYELSFFKDFCKDRIMVGKLFTTKANHYLYDTGTNKILSCSELEFKVLNYIINKEPDKIYELETEYSEEKIQEACETVKIAIVEENLLKISEFEMTYFNSNALSDEVENNLEQITLELTEKCNLRCRYCLYENDYDNMRNHGTTDMTLETAKAAIDYIFNHSKNRDKIAITFYGGEPLLKLDLIKQCIEYVKGKNTDKTVNYSFTTNLTLINEENADYFGSIENLVILCSLDGPKDIHDSYRKDVHGAGSFDRAIRGLKLLIEAYRKYDRPMGAIGINMVFTPPFKNEKMDKIQAFIKDLDWLPEDVQIRMTYPVEGSVEITSDDVERESEGGIITTIGDWTLEKCLESDDKIFSDYAFVDPLTNIHQRPMYKDSVKYIPFNGACIPGQRKLYVTTKGELTLCEKIGSGAVLGNVFDGIDIDRLEQIYVTDYCEKSSLYCKDCWAARLCKMCYAHCYTEGELDMAKKNGRCEITKQYMNRYLVIYNELVENNPDKLKYIDELEIS